MKIEITSHYGFTDILSSAPASWDLILICSPGGVNPPEEFTSIARRTLHLFFDDHDNPSPGVVLPTIEDIKEAVEWSLSSEKLLVACYMGRSRSAALAYIIQCREVVPEYALQILLPRWHRPNRLIVRIGAEILENPNVLHAFDEWQTKL
ncbi:MAG: hypothetical protein R3B84_15195 [Zavarzinella sp.]